MVEIAIGRRYVGVAGLGWIVDEVNAKPRKTHQQPHHIFLPEGPIKAILL